MKKISKKIYIISLIALLLFLIFFYIKNLNSNNDDSNNNQNKNNNKLEIMETSFNSRTETLKNYNFNDFFTIGWIQVQGTNIDFPVFTPILKGKEENGDVKVDFSYAWRQINYNLGENRMVLSAHNIINVSSKPIKDMNVLTDFEGLMAFVYHDFAIKNQYIMYTDEDGNEELYVIYAVGFTNSNDEEYKSIKYDDKDKINEYISSAKNNSIYNYSVNVNSEDKILSLVTCTRFFGRDGDTLFRIDARKVRENENTYKYKVDINSNYKIINEKLNEEDI